MLPRGVIAACWIVLLGAFAVAAPSVKPGSPPPELATSAGSDYGVRITPPPGAPRSFPRNLSAPGDYIEHVVVPNEKLEQIAARYGVSKLHLQVANHKRLGKGGFRAGRTIRLKARRRPAARKRTLTTVKPGEDWTAITRRLGVSRADLRAWNWRSSRLKPGRELTAWIDPDRRQTLFPEQPMAKPTIEIRADALSAGRPDLGRVRKAVRLPPSYLYKLKSPRTSWGSRHAVATVLDAIVDFRTVRGFRGPLLIGSMSRRKGGKFRPHSSHQSGRDIDIFFPLLDEIPFTWNPHPAMVDWTAVWALVNAFDATKRIEVIFIDSRVQKHLHAAARRAGASDAELDRLIGWPRWPAQQRHALVRHSPGHTRHMHVRVACGESEPECYSRWGDKRHRVIETARKARQKAKRR